MINLKLGSQAAEELKEDIHKNLPNVLGYSFNDDAIATYLVALVCKGKDKAGIIKGLKGVVSSKKIATKTVEWLLDYLNKNEAKYSAIEEATIAQTSSQEKETTLISKIPAPEPATTTLEVVAPPSSNVISTFAEVAHAEATSVNDILKEDHLDTDDLMEEPAPWNELTRDTPESPKNASSSKPPLPNGRESVVNISINNTLNFTGDNYDQNNKSKVFEPASEPLVSSTMNPPPPLSAQPVISREESSGKRSRREPIVWNSMSAPSASHPSTAATASTPVSTSNNSTSAAALPTNTITTLFSSTPQVSSSSHDTTESGGNGNNAEGAGASNRRRGGPRIGGAIDWASWSRQREEAPASDANNAVSSSDISMSKSGARVSGVKRPHEKMEGENVEGGGGEKGRESTTEDRVEDKQGKREDDGEEDKVSKTAAAAAALEKLNERLAKFAKNDSNNMNDNVARLGGNKISSESDFAAKGVQRENKNATSTTATTAITAAGSNSSILNKGDSMVGFNGMNLSALPLRNPAAVATMAGALNSFFGGATGNLFMQNLGRGMTGGGRGVPGHFGMGFPGMVPGPPRPPAGPPPPLPSPAAAGEVVGGPSSAAAAAATAVTAAASPVSVGGGGGNVAALPFEAQLCQVIVSNIPAFLMANNIATNILTAHFSVIGPLRSIEVLPLRGGGGGAGGTMTTSAYLEFFDEESAMLAMSLNRSRLQNVHLIFVSL
eukprot:CAMPEP_0175057288 /NCGR_PEP_ID=MMETSP0052_2-20121109/11178_1 /TAXON_ID=51329 ORGANISM="Polytomella parva, Strain SAG 63-3" /NCGR_SAMPLE_ID=MMETSP0052_2 /ASSEMBLY_ACC=CAM_ASM_000194 /LENGTH=722 /DNA_ID=CAMNT_0016322479 /DNA_START=23 /DNA_END=2188 /DNA_ORIENTATION=+